MCKKAAYITLGEMRFDTRISFPAKLIYGEIVVLAKKEGFCWATDQWFADAYSVNIRSVKRWIAELEQQGYITKQTQYVKTLGKKIRKIQLVNQDQSDKSVPLDSDKNVPLVGVKGQNCHGQRDKNVPLVGDKNVPYNNTRMNITTTTDKKDGSENDVVVVVKKSGDHRSIPTKCESEGYGTEGKNRISESQTLPNSEANPSAEANAQENSGNQSSFVLPRKNPSVAGPSGNASTPPESSNNNNNNAEAGKPMTEKELRIVAGLVKQFGFCPNDAQAWFKKYGFDRVRDAANYAYVNLAGKTNPAGWCVDCIKAGRKLTAMSFKRQQSRMEEELRDKRRAEQRMKDFEQQYQETLEYEAKLAAQQSKEVG